MQGGELGNGFFEREWLQVWLPGACSPQTSLIIAPLSQILTAPVQEQDKA
jgi:hypothetical protein